LTSTSPIVALTRSEHHRGEHDHVNRKYEQRGVPDIPQQGEPGALRRNAIVTIQAAIIISEIGAT
jgi:hypothetical protein